MTAGACRTNDPAVEFKHPSGTLPFESTDYGWSATVAVRGTDVELELDGEDELIEEVRPSITARLAELETLDTAAREILVEFLDESVENDSVRLYVESMLPRCLDALDDDQRVELFGTTAPTTADFLEGQALRSIQILPEFPDAHFLVFDYGLDEVEGPVLCVSFDTTGQITSVLLEN